MGIEKWVINSHLQQQTWCVFDSNLICASRDVLPRLIRWLRFYQFKRTQLNLETLQLSDRVAGEGNRQPESRMKRVTARRTKIGRSWYSNTKIEKEISQERRRRDADRKGNRTERVRGVEGVTHPSVESTYLSLSSGGYLHLGPTLTAPAIA